MTTTPAPGISIFQKIEAEVMSFITAVENDVEIIIADAEKALSNVAAMVPSIAADIEGVATFVEGIPGVGQQPAVQEAVAAANIAMTGLNAFASAWNKSTTGGKVTVSQASQAVVAGFQAAQLAKAATANLSATVTGSTKTAVSTPAPTA
jgi:hypothetical protein